MPTPAPRQELRADYASTRGQADGAWIASVVDGSPAWEAGLEAGMRILTVNGVTLRDIIDWRWEADGEVAELEVRLGGEGEPYVCTLEREPGQDWGVAFTDVLFDGVRTCVNACQFCFMAMLPPGSRASLSLRDDDYRLSFLQGNFVTLTNVSDEDVERIIECRLEPMNVSLHAISPEVRRTLIGRNHQRGIDALKRLLDARIEVHGQIVVCMGINDGDELRRTLDWVEAQPTFTSLALVPMGYTKYARCVPSSFSEDREASREVVRLLEPYRRRARRERNITRFQLSDEFYLDADLPVPPADTYDGYPQFYDGIGMLRSFLDEARDLCAQRAGELGAVARRLAARGRSALLVCGEAAEGAIDALCVGWQEAAGLDAPCARPFAVRNDYYGGDVNVTGLIVGCDLRAQLPDDLGAYVVVLPEVMFNSDNVTLDGDTRAHLVGEVEARGGEAVVAMTTPAALLEALG